MRIAYGSKKNAKYQHLGCANAGGECDSRCCETSRASSHEVEPSHTSIKHWQGTSKVNNSSFERFSQRFSIQEFFPLTEVNGRKQGLIRGSENGISGDFHIKSGT